VRPTRCVGSSTGNETDPEEDDAAPSPVPKILGLSTVFFCSTFNYTLLQNVKDSMIVTSVGAEALPFLEALGVLPASMVFFVLYSKLMAWLPPSQVYRAALAPLLIFYTVFGGLLYPNAAFLHPMHLLESMRSALPAGLNVIASMLAHWTYSLFYITAELWGGVAISMLFWGLADGVCTMHEAETVYPILGIIANVGLVLAGALVKLINANSDALLSATGMMPVQATIATVLVMSGLLLSVKGFVQDTYLTPGIETHSRAKSKKKGKAKPRSLRESLSVVMHNPKVAHLAVLVLSYFVASKLFDFAWKSSLLKLYPSTTAYAHVLAGVSQAVGFSTIGFMIASKWVFKWGGWAAAGLATPAVMLVAGAGFFLATIALNSGAAEAWGIQQATLITLGSVAGIVGRVASRSFKYSFFDPSKEMVFITLTPRDKLEGKAAVDLLGSYIGKTGASVIMQALVLITGSLTTALPFIAVAYTAILLAWTRSTLKLAELMPASSSAPPAEPEAPAEPTLAPAST